MAVDVSKLHPIAIIGSSGGISVSKLMAAAIMAPGTEEGAPEPDPRQGYTYAQILRPASE